MLGNTNAKGGKGKKHSPFSEETKEKLRELAKGRRISEETKIKMSKAHKGKHKSEKHKKNISLAKKGEKNSAWQGGISFELYTTDWTETLRRSIRERDRYTCRSCGKQQGNQAFPIHHIDYDKKNCNPENLITLCYRCHSKTNFNREYWKNYFELIQRNLYIENLQIK